MLWGSVHAQSSRDDNGKPKTCQAASVQLFSLISLCHIHLPENQHYFYYYCCCYEDDDEIIEFGEARAEGRTTERRAVIILLVTLTLFSIGTTCSKGVDKGPAKPWHPADCQTFVTQSTQEIYPESANGYHAVA